MRKVILFIASFILILVGFILLITNKNEFSVDEINTIVKSYNNKDFVSLKDERVVEYFNEYYNNDEILEFEVLHDNTSCLTLFFLPHNASKDTIEACNRFFAKNILITPGPMGGPIILDSDLRKELRNKNLRIYIGDRLAIDYNFKQKEYTIVDSKIIEDLNHVYNQRIIKDKLSVYINRELKNYGYKNISIEKSFNNNFLIVKMKGHSIESADELFSSGEFIKELRKSKHDYISEVRIVLN